jgi:hypothetical protein
MDKRIGVYITFDSDGASVLLGSYSVATIKRMELGDGSYEYRVRLNQTDPRHDPMPTFTGIPAAVAYVFENLPAIVATLGKG